MTTTGGFPPFITAQLNYLVHHFPFSLKMEQAWSGSKNYPLIFDRFTLCIPYCLGFIKWDDIYNAELPLCPPDFIFGAEDESFRLLTGIEMQPSSGLEKPEQVKFAVPLLGININTMVLGCPWRHLQKIQLQVAYPVFRKNSSAPSAPRLKLVSTPALKALFSIDDVKLPSWVDGMCMAEYLPYLEQRLHGQIMEAVSSINVRRRFIEALRTVFGRPMES